jgi:RNA polymerase sigma factor (sigma-70 family)
MDLESLERWFERSRRGDVRAWAKLVESLSGIVMAAIRRTRLSREDGEDIFGLTMATLYQNLDRVESGAALPGWIARVATREAIRRSQATKAKSTDELNEDWMGFSEEDVSGALLASERADTVRTALTQLDPTCQLLLTSLFSDDPVPYDDLAKRAGIKIGSIGPKRARCLNALRQILESNPLFAESSQTTPTS